MQSAIVLGATGLVGREIVALLEQDPAVERVVLLVRRAPDRALAKKTEVRVTNFREPASFAEKLAAASPNAADVLFSALGTTLKTAGSKEAQYEVDYTFQYEVAKAAKAAGVATVSLCSSLGASPDARSFYTRMKGELERDVIALGFARTRIVRPSFLDGDREESRPGEKVGMWIMHGLGKLPGIARYRPVSVRTVAGAMIALAKDETPGVKVVENHELFALA
ncbi:MAG: NAD(P)H-binding protein [Labilithrix sp.]|nr:NAD(P)H-binding protein [Labilithrix sp.]MCW5813137.1 NAD(P)H-binding protein [Labilithrix sp.]